MTLRLPKYTDSEVDNFHPVMEYCLNKALQEMELEDNYYIVHHEQIKNLECDFVIKRRCNHKYVLFIEVKRLPGDVSSTRYRYQARSYVAEAGNMVEKPYYMVSNLELIDIFKFSRTNLRTSVLEQLIKPSPIRIGDLLSDNPTDFCSNLIINLKELMNIVINDIGEYTSISNTFPGLLSSYRSNQNKWHQLFMVSGYELIRGSLNDIRHLGWREAIRYRHNPRNLLNVATNLNFQEIFTEPLPPPDDSELWNIELLKELYQLGLLKRSGDDIAEITHSIVTTGREHEGFVSTDRELALVLGVILKYLCGRELNSDEKVCDPAAGMGSLLSVLPLSFTNLQPKQIWANDFEKQFLELLEIRLGLAFPNSINIDNYPKITIQDVLNLTPDDFTGIKLVALNPPFIAGIDCRAKKERFARRIHELTGNAASLHIGQIGLEALFLELIVSLVSDDTLMGIILPKQYISGQGREAKAFRNFLINTFGLKFICSYPKVGLFESVIKSTFLAFGIPGSNNEFIEVLNIDIPLEEVDSQVIYNTLDGMADVENDSFINLDYGIKYKKATNNHFPGYIDDGMRSLTSSGYQVECWIAEHLSEECVKLEDTPFQIRRGALGNTGGSNFIFPNSNRNTWNQIKDLIPTNWLKPAIRTVDNHNSLYLSMDTAEVKVLSIPGDCFDPRFREHRHLQTLIDRCLSLQSITGSGQRRNLLTRERLISILSTVPNSSTPQNSVLVPRNIRRKGRIFFAQEECYISTNLFQIWGLEPRIQKLLFSWLLTIFSQLDSEFQSKDQEGTRKNEKRQIQQLFIPRFESISHEDQQTILNNLDSITDFVDLCSPHISENDRIWASILWQNADNITNKALELLNDIVFERYPNCNISN
jgi:hypothetical protein